MLAQPNAHFIFFHSWSSAASWEYSGIIQSEFITHTQGNRTNVFSICAIIAIYKQHHYIAVVGRSIPKDQNNNTDCTRINTKKTRSEIRSKRKKKKNRLISVHEKYYGGLKDGVYRHHHSSIAQRARVLRWRRRSHFTKSFKNIFFFFFFFKQVSFFLYYFTLRRSRSHHHHPRRVFIAFIVLTKCIHIM